MRSRRNRRAFTLLEVLIVIVILGLLAALVVPNFLNTTEGAKRDMTENMIKGTLRAQLELFQTHCGRFPTSEEGLQALITKPDDETITDKWRGPYLKAKEVKDAWQRPFEYTAPGTYNQDSYDLSSAGRDGQFGTEDDITNYERT